MTDGALPPLVDNGLNATFSIWLLHHLFLRSEKLMETYMICVIERERERGGGEGKGGEREREREREREKRDC